MSNRAEEKWRRPLIQYPTPSPAESHVGTGRRGAFSPSPNRRRGSDQAAPVSEPQSGPQLVASLRLIGDRARQINDEKETWQNRAEAAENWAKEQDLALKEERDQVLHLRRQIQEMQLEKKSQQLEVEALKQKVLDVAQNGVEKLKSPLPDVDLYDSAVIASAVEKHLDEGGCATISLVTLSILGQSVRAAWKKPLGGTGPERELLVREGNVQRLASGHPSILNVLGFSYHKQAGSNQPVYDGLLTPYAQGGSLLKVLTYTREPSMTRLLASMLGIVDAVESVHVKKIVHGDLKLANVFFNIEIDLEKDSENSPEEIRNAVRLGDFGLAGQAHWVGGEGQGTSDHMAPELFVGETRTEQSDIYAVGIMFFILMTGHPKPYLGEDYDGTDENELSDETKRKLLEGECLIDFKNPRFRKVCFNDCPAAYYERLSELIKLILAERPPISEIKEVLLTISESLASNEELLSWNLPSP